MVFLSWKAKILMQSSQSEFLKSYDQAEDTLKKLFDSRLRVAILAALEEGPLRLADLRREVHANAPNTSSKAKELEVMGFIDRVDGNFELTNFGMATLGNTKELLNFYSTYKKFEDFWRTHENDCIPEFLFKRLGDLKKSELLSYDPTDMQAIDQTFYAIIRKSKKFWRGFFPVLDPEWLDLSIEASKKGLEFEFIFTPKILETVLKNKRWLNKISHYTRLKLFELDIEPKILFAIGDNFFDMSLKLKAYNVNLWDVDLLSFDPKAIKWGLDLFEHYKKQAKPVKLKDYL